VKNFIFNKVALYLIIGLFTAQITIAQTPKLFLADYNKVAAVKKSAATNKDIQKQIALLQKSADQILDKKIASVVEKKFATPCGNKHEYMSLASYYWPDPSKPDGLPYIRKDGQRNPDNDKISDHKGFDDLIKYVTTLSWAYYFTNDEKYAAKGVSLLRFWCIDTATYMLPNLNHAQIIMGTDTGRGIGIIDVHLIPNMLDGIGILETSKSMSKADAKAIHQWFDQFLVWLQTSVNGKQEFATKNNHKTYYETLVASMALFCDKQDVAKQIFANAKSLMASQFQPDGKLPLELERTNAFSYTSFCLRAWAMLSNLAEKVNVDLWHYETKDGRSIQKGFEYIMPYALAEKKWEYQQIGPINLKDLSQALLFTKGKLTIPAYSNNDSKFSEKLNAIDLLVYQ
jgi:hypothetical protein